MSSERGQAWRRSPLQGGGFLLPLPPLPCCWDWLPSPLFCPLQLPGWSQGPEGSLIIALGNEDALGEYSCTPYNSLGTAGPSPVTRVLLKVSLWMGSLTRPGG